MITKNEFSFFFKFEQLKGYCVPLKVWYHITYINQDKQSLWKPLHLHYHYYHNRTILLFIINVISVNDSGDSESYLRKHNDDTTACLWNIHPPSGWRPRGFLLWGIVWFRIRYSRCTLNSPHTITFLLHICSFFLLQLRDFNNNC